MTTTDDRRHRAKQYLPIKRAHNNAWTTSSQLWLTRRGRVEVHRIWHLSLVTMRHLVHWDRQTNSCLAVLTRLSSWPTKHCLLVLQRSGMTCLFNFRAATCVNSFKCNLNANLSPARMLITPHNSRISRFWLRFLHGLIGAFYVVFCIVLYCVSRVRQMATLGHLGV